MGTHRVHGCGYALPARASVDLYKNPVLKAPYLMLRFLLITWEESFFFFFTSPQSEGSVHVILWHLAPKEGPALGGKRNLRKRLWPGQQNSPSPAAEGSSGPKIKRVCS